VAVFSKKSCKNYNTTQIIEKNSLGLQVLFPGNISRPASRRKSRQNKRPGPWFRTGDRRWDGHS